jgi:hypothetical protein
LQEGRSRQIDEKEKKYEMRRDDMGVVQNLENL